MNRRNDISIGGDPEFFLKKGNKIVTSIGKIGGKKGDYKVITYMRIVTGKPISKK